MATIKQSVSYIMEHPFMALALKDRAAMEKLLWEVHFHCYTVVAANGAKEFRKWKGFNDPVVLAAIRDQEPPCNLDIRLPIPPVQEECPVVELRVVRPNTRAQHQKNPGHITATPTIPKKIRVRLSPDPFQLMISFPVAVSAELRDLMEG